LRHFGHTECKKSALGPELSLNMRSYMTCESLPFVGVSVAEFKPKKFELIFLDDSRSAVLQMFSKVIDRWRTHPLNGD
jgi:RNase adaptor protein for sRNA GlmZ degradation